MTTYDKYANGRRVAASGGAIDVGAPAVTVISNVVDISQRAALAAADVLEVLDIPANCLVMHVGYKVLTADATQTINIGDGADPDGYVAAADVGTAGNVGCSTLALTEGTPNVATGYSEGKFYAAADTIDIEVPATKALDTLKVRVTAVVALLG